MEKNRIENTGNVIAVIGMHRSGTSVLAHSIQALGIDLGDNLMPPVEGNNAKGFFEDLELNRICDLALAEQDLAWDRLAPLHATNEDPHKFSDKLMLNARDTLRRKTQNKKLFCFKNPRVSLLLPFWQSAFSDMKINEKYVLSVRNPLEVAASLQKRDEITRSTSLLLWINHTFAAIRGTNGRPRKFIQYRALLENPKETIFGLADFLGIKHNTISVDEIDNFCNEFLDQDLRHHRASDSLRLSADVPELVRKLYRIQCSLADGSLEDGSIQFGKAWLSIETHYKKMLIAFEAVQSVDKKLRAVVNENRLLKAAIVDQVKHDMATGQHNSDQGSSTSKDWNSSKDAASVTAQLRAATAEKNHLLQVIASEQTEHQLAQLSMDLDGANKLIRELSTDNGRLNSENDKLRQGHLDLATIQKQLTQAKQTIDDQAAARNDDRETIRHLETAIKALNASIHSIEKLWSTRLHDVQTNARKMNSQMSREKEKLQTQLTATRRAIAEQDRLIEQYQSSNSFKLTAPLRKLRSATPQSPAAARSQPVLQLLWQSLPFEESRIKFKDHAFGLFRPVISNRQVYLNWIEHQEEIAKQANLVSTRTDEPPPKTASPTAEHNANAAHPLKRQAQFWDESSSILKLFNAEPEILHERVPSNILEHAHNLTKDSSLTVSVIIPTWNREKSVVEAVGSVLRQTSPVDEIIISDDGSQDNTINVIRQTFRRELDSGLIKLIENDHGGVCAARNSGMEHATGDIFTYLDSDNQWRENYALLIKAVFEENDEIATAYAGLNSLDLDTQAQMARASYYQRRRLIDGNFIDLNIFAHRRVLFEQLGGFDEDLTRLVDWELIIRYTENYLPMFLPFVGVDYFLSATELNNITHSVPLDTNRSKVLDKHFIERVSRKLERLRIAYFVYDYPARSQTFVFNEIRWLINNNYDVNVYYHIEPADTAVLDFSVDTYQVADSLELAALLRKHERNICHTQFAYPGVTLFVQPACADANVRFTFMPHAVDIFHFKNRERNHIDKVAQDPNCLRVFVYGNFHRSFITARGVPRSKIAYAFQSVDRQDFLIDGQQPKTPSPDKELRGIVIARFIEKKGLCYLLEAMALLKDSNLSMTLYGWGPLETELQEQASLLGLHNVKFAGPIDGKSALADAYNNADFLVAPCVEAEDGDMDGFPTVILEAMSAGLPVITTGVSAIPDYLRNEVEAIVVEPKDAGSLAAGISRLRNMSPNRRQALIANADEFLRNRIGTDRTMHQLLDTWQGFSIDILLVTFNVDGYDDRAETFEIISRIFNRTTTWFTLTIVDNNSSPDFWNSVVEHVRGFQNVRLIRKKTNSLCGPASNIALEHCNSEFLIYICSKEGFIKTHGWERPLINYMRANPEIILAGYKTHLPNYTTGAEMVNHPDFSKFRGQPFAHQNPSRVFEHVQGGVFICRRQELLALGAFNPLLPQGNMDVELSYWLESQGKILGSITEISSVTTKTLPPIETRINENTCIAHPLSMNNVSQLDTLDTVHSQKCLLCGHQYHESRTTGQDNVFDESSFCKECGSTPFGRMVYQFMVSHHQTHKQKTIALLAEDQSLAGAMGNRLFKTIVSKPTVESLISDLKAAAISVDCLVIDTHLTPNLKQFLASVSKYLSSESIILYSVPIENQMEQESFQVIEKDLKRNGWRVDAETVKLTSTVHRLDWRDLRKLTLTLRPTHMLAS